MTEEIKPTEEKPTEAPVEAAPVNIVDQAKAEREALKTENDRMEKNIKDLKELEANKILGGTAGGHIPAPEKKEETPKEYKDRILAGQ